MFGSTLNGKDATTGGTANGSGILDESNAKKFEVVKEPNYSADEIMEMAENVEDCRVNEDFEMVPYKGWTGRLANFATMKPLFGSNLNGKWAAYENGAFNASRHVDTPQFQLPVYGHLLTHFTSSHFGGCTIVSAPTGSGKSIGSICALLQASQGRRMKCLFIMPTIFAANQLHETLCTFFSGSKVKPVGVLTSESSDYREDLTSVLIVTPGIAMVLLDNDYNFTHIIMDEAHQRGFQSNHILYLLREKGNAKSSLQVVIMTASVEAISRIQSYFADYKFIEVKPEQKDVFEIKEICWNAVRAGTTGKKQTLELLNALVETTKDEVDKLKAQPLVDDVNESDPIAVDEAFEAIKFIVGLPNSGETGGAVIVFVSGSKAMNDLREKLLRSFKPSVTVYLLHGSIETDPEMMNKKQQTKRKIIITTNIAESSVTFIDARFVVDTMLEKTIEGFKVGGFFKLIEQQIGANSRIQRRGRIGRTCSGYYFAICSLKFFADPDEGGSKMNVRSDDPLAHILYLIRNNLSPTIMTEQYIDSVDSTVVVGALNELSAFGLVRGKHTDDAKLTALGCAAAEMISIGPEVSIMVIVGSIFGCSEYVMRLGSTLLCDIPVIRHHRDGKTFDPVKKQYVDSAYTINVGMSYPSEHLVLADEYNSASQELGSMKFNTGISATEYYSKRGEMNRLLNVRAIELSNAKYKRIKLYVDRVQLIDYGIDLQKDHGTMIARILSIVSGCGHHCGMHQEEPNPPFVGPHFKTFHDDRFQAETKLLRDSGSKYVAVYERMPIFEDNVACGPVTLVKPFFFACFGAMGCTSSFGNGKFTLRDRNFSDIAFFECEMPNKLCYAADLIRSKVYDLVVRSDPTGNKKADKCGTRLTLDEKKKVAAGILEFAAKVYNYEIPQKE